MWLWFATVVAALLQTGPAHSNSGLTSTSFSNELRTGFARLFQNGVEQPVQPSPFVLLQRDPVVDFRVGNPLLQQRPVQYGPPEPTFQSPPRPRYELQYQSWAIPYYYVPARFHPGFGKSRPNDVLVVVVKTGSNCTGAANGTTPADDDADDDGDDKGPSPDDDVEEVTIVTGGTEKGKEPSRCVWAILACCAPANVPIRYTCFDVLGCSTAFWDTNPCVPAILQAAVDQAAKYYGPIAATNKTVTTPPTPVEPTAVDLTAAVTSATAPAAATSEPPAGPTTPAAS